MLNYKQKGKQIQGKKPGGGWASDSEEEEQQKQSNIMQPSSQNKDNQIQSNFLQKYKFYLAFKLYNQIKERNTQNNLKISSCNKKILLNQFQLMNYLIQLSYIQIFQQNTNIFSQYEQQLISENIQPGGARLKQSDKMLEQFSIACESLDCQIVSSILLCCLLTEQNIISKIKVLYLIETLIKSNKKYFAFVLHNIAILESQQDEKNQQFAKLNDSIIQFLKNPSSSQLQQPKQTKFIISEFINENLEIKNMSQAITKQPENQDLIGFAENKPKMEKHDLNLLDESPQQQKKEVQKQLNSFEFIKQSQNLIQNNEQINLINDSQDKEQDKKEQNGFSFVKNKKLSQQNVSQKSEHNEMLNFINKNAKTAIIQQQKDLSFITKQNEKQANLQQQTQQSNQQNLNYKYFDQQQSSISQQISALYQQNLPQQQQQNLYNYQKQDIHMQYKPILGMGMEGHNWDEKADQKSKNDATKKKTGYENDPFDFDIKI